MDYQIKAVRDKQIVLLSISAVNVEDALSQAKIRGYTPIAASAKPHSFTGRANKKFPLVQFSQELLALLEAGLNLVEAIETLAVKDESNNSRTATACFSYTLRCYN
jgi:general secretion pathway protein F